MELREKTLKSDVVYKGKILDVLRKKVLLPDGREGAREVVKHSGAVAVVAVDKTGEIYLVEQFRSPMEKVMLEIPAGKLDPGEGPEEAALRELWEETGMKAGHLEKMSAFYSSPGYSDELIHLFLASDLTKAGRPRVPGEFLHIRTFEAGKLMEMIRRGEIEDGKTILGVSLFLNQYNTFI